MRTEYVGLEERGTRISNKESRILMGIKKGILRRVGRLQRMPKGRVPKRIFHGNPEGKKGNRKI